MTYTEILDKLVSREHHDSKSLSYVSDILLSAKDEENPDVDLILKYGKWLKVTASLKAHSDPALIDVYYRALFALARYDFDSYLIYMEKDRPAKNRFYLPRRKQLLKIGAVQLMQDMEDDKLDVGGLSVVPGAGKAQPLYSKVLTPDGFKAMGNIRVGDEVISGTGKVSYVLGIFPQGKKSIYELTFDDGSKCRCSEDHLWKCYFARKDWHDWHVISLSELIQFRNETRKSVYVEQYAEHVWTRLRLLKDVSYVGEEECQCIYIDDPSHLYITDDYIITHNTSIEEFFITWVIGRHVDDYNIFASHSGGICRMFYDAVDAITGSAEYKFAEIFPEVKRQSTNAKEMQINFGKYKPFKSLSCVSIGQNLAGRVRANRYLLNDDLISGIEEAVSKPRLDKVWQSYSVDLLQRRIDKCKELHICTRWSVHDPIGRVMQKNVNNPRARFIAVPDIDPETGESNFDYQYGVGFSTAYFKDVEQTMDDVSYRCLYKNEPIEREGLLYPEDSLRRFLSLPDSEPDAILGICDTKGKGTDYMFLPCFYKYGEDYYMVDCICSNETDFAIQYENMAGIIIRNKMQMVDFESNSGGDRVALEVEKLIQGKQPCGITTHYTTQNKETKIIVNAEWVKKHCLFLDRSKYSPKSDYGVAMAFLTSYTVAGRNLFDDVVDGLAQFAQFTGNLLGRDMEIMNSPF